MSHVTNFISNNLITLPANEFLTSPSKEDTVGCRKMYDYDDEDMESARKQKTPHGKGW